MLTPIKEVENSHLFTLKLRVCVYTGGCQIDRKIESCLIWHDATATEGFVSFLESG